MKRLLRNVNRGGALPASREQEVGESSRLH